MDDFMIEQQADELIPDNYEEIQELREKERQNAYSNSNFKM